MLYRVPGVATAWRYANTELYSNSSIKPDHLSYKEYLNVIIDSYDFDFQKAVKITINGYIKHHDNKTYDKIHDEDPHPLSGVSWKFLCRVALRGDFKGRQQTAAAAEAIRVREKMGITQEDAIKIYGKKN
jgi:predicted phosphoadenosine phosphosulfate sulfurtransferase